MMSLYRGWPNPQFNSWSYYPTDQGRSVLGTRPPHPTTALTHIADIAPIQSTREFVEAYNTATLNDPNAAD